MSTHIRSPEGNGYEQGLLERRAVGGLGLVDDGGDRQVAAD